MAGNEDAIKGVLKIEIDEQELSVTLRIDRSSDGDEWTVDALGEAIKERGVSGDLKAKTLQEFISAAAKSTEKSYEAVVLEGVPPVLPAPESVEWSELSVPEQLDTAIEAVLEKSESPKIFRERSEKIERTQQVEKKAKLPFMAKKTETVTVTESKTHRERVPVDPTVTQHFYVEAGSVLGEVMPQRIGIPGRTVKGRTIQVTPITDPFFYAGDNISRQGNTLTASTSGIVRIGRNWADIVTFSPHRWELELSSDKATCYLVFTPGHRDSPAPSAAEILSAAVELPYPSESLITEEELTQLIRGQIEIGSADRVPITLSRDASFDIFVSEDKLHATLNVHKGKGRGKPLSLREIGGEIKKSGIRGLDFKKIQDDITAFYEGGDFDLTGYVLAEGVPATAGQERQVEFALRFHDEDKTKGLRDRLAQSSDQPDSIADFPADKITRTADVEAEQLICTIDPVVPGESGTDVYGKEIPGEPGPSPEFHLYENVEQKELLISTSSAGVLDWAEEDGSYFLRVRSHTDAVVAVEIDQDEMTARISLSEGVGSGDRLSRELVEAAIANAGVVTGIDGEVIAKALLAAQAGTAVDGVPFAHGTEPIDQSENEVEFLVKLDSEAGVRLRKDGSADYRSQNRIVTVTKDQEICRILTSKSEAVDGESVKGATIAAGGSTAAPIEIGEGLEKIEQDDGSSLIRATTEGELVKTGNKLEIRSSFNVDGDVDMSVGNIKFPGSIQIKGSVRSGFYVVSTGDIKIGGGVEAALLSADGDILVKEGVKGAGKAVLRSKSRLMSSFVELATVLSVGDIVLKSAVVRSRIKCNGHIGFQGNNGRIVGGIVRARNGVTVQSIGTSGGIKTHISFGQDYLIADLIEKEEKEIDKVKLRVSQIDVDMRRREKAGDAAALEKLRHEKIKLLKLLEKRGLRLFTLRERFEQHFPSKIEVAGEVHSGTVFESHGRLYEITSTKKGLRVEFNSQTGNIDVNELSEE